MSTKLHENLRVSKESEGVLKTGNDVHHLHIVLGRRNGEESVLKRVVLDANDVVAEVAEHVVGNHEKRVLQRLRSERLVRQFQRDLHVMEEKEKDGRNVLAIDDGKVHHALRHELGIPFVRLHLHDGLGGEVRDHIPASKKAQISPTQTEASCLRGSTFSSKAASGGSKSPIALDPLRLPRYI